MKKILIGNKILAGIVCILIISTGVSGFTYSEEKPVFIEEIMMENTLAVENEGVLLGVSPDGKGWLGDLNGQLILYLSGTGYEMGYQHGYLLKEEIKRTINGWIYGGKKSTGNPSSVLQDLYSAQVSYIPQRYKDEMQGIADATEIPLIDIQTTQVKPDVDLFSCRQIATWGNATIDGDLYHARSLGYPITFRDDESGVAMQDHSIIIVAKPEGYYPFVSFAWPGSVGGVTAMNAEGISLAINNVLTTDTTPKGLARPFKVRKVLEEAKNIDEAIFILNQSKTVGWCMCLSDGKVPEAYGVEMSGSLFYAGPWNDPVEYYNDEECLENGYLPYEPLDGCVIRFGHMYRDPGLAETRLSPKTREPAGYNCQSAAYQGHVNMIKEKYGQGNVDLLGDILYALEDPMGSILHCSIFSSSTLNFCVSNAIGSKGAQNFYPYYLNLNTLLNIQPPPSDPDDMPTVDITNPSGGNTVSWFKRKVTIKGDAHDNTKIAEVYVKVDGEDYELADGTTSWEKTIDTSNWKRGSWHRIKVLAIDESGNGNIDIIGLYKFRLFDRYNKQIDWLINWFQNLFDNNLDSCNCY